jgi:hypothetical protein
MVAHFRVTRRIPCIASHCSRPQAHAAAGHRADQTSRCFSDCAAFATVTAGQPRCGHLASCDEAATAAITPV